MSLGIPLVVFAGLPLATLLGVFAGVALLTIGLYILKLRRRQVSVPFLNLWESLLVERKASVLRSRLQRLLSLLLSLLLIAALILALGDPQSEDARKEGRSIVVLIDVSASMGVRAGEISRLERAQKKVRSWFASLGGGDQILLVEMGAHPRPIEAFTGDVQALSKALEGLRILDVSADLEASLNLARDALRGRTSPQIIVVSDGALPPSVDSPEGSPPLFFEAVAKKGESPGANIAVTGFSARRYPSSKDNFEVLVEVENSGTESAEVEISIFESKTEGTKGALLDLHRVSLLPGERFVQSYKNLDHAEEGLFAEVTRTDGIHESFIADNLARTLLSPRVPVKLLVVGEPNNFLEAALLVEESLEVERVSAEKYPPKGEFDLTIFDGVFPKRDSKTGAALYLGAPDSAEEGFPLEVSEKKIELFGFDTWKKDSTLFRLIDPYNIQVLEGRSLIPADKDVVLASSEDRPILIQGLRPEGRFVAMGFSPKKSDFVLRAVWPLFVLNVVDELFPRGRSDIQLGLKTGSVWRPPAGVEDGSVEVRGPLGAKEQERTRRVPVDEGRAVFFGQEAGFYELSSKKGKSRFAASILSAEESRLPPSDELWLGESKAEKVRGMRSRSGHQPWAWLLLGVFAVSFLEWWTYHQRWTV